MKLDTFFNNFGLLADAPNGVQKLREMILQLAVQGKLVPQDPKDEHASVLLEKINAEKERLIKEGKIKKTKPLPPIKSEDLPYDLKDSWEWVRLGDYSHIIMGQSPPSKYYNENKLGLPFYQGKSEFGDMYPSPKKWCESPKKVARNNDVLISVRAPVGPTNVCKEKSCIGRGLTAIRCLAGADYLYLLYQLRATESYVASLGVGSTFVAISKTDLESLLFPVPPLEEQKRIVAKVDELLALCDELEARKQQVGTNCIQLNDASIHKLLTASEPTKFSNHWQRICDSFDLLYNKPKNVTKLRQAILQLAVQGKLVPQDPKDEPASVLIEKIKAEKERLIKEGKIKKTKLLPPINPDEIPYDLPNGWKWVRLAEIGLINPRNEIGDKTKVSFVPMKLVPTELTDRVRSEIHQWEDIKKGFTHFSEGDVALAKITPCFQNRKSVVMRGLKNGLGAGTTELHIFRPLTNLIVSEYVLLYLKTPKFINEGVSKMTGSAGQKRVPKTHFSETPFPLPPFNEQKHIVAKVDELMALCDELETRLSQSQTDCDRLMEGTIAEILAA